MSPSEFENCFKMLYLPLGMYALRIVGDVDCAEDLVQEAFMKVWQASAEGGDVTNIKGYLYMTVRNLCFSYLRQRRDMEGSEMIPELDDDAVDTSERDAAVWRAIDGLPDKCREIFLLSKRDGLSNQEIADELGISLKTVKNQMTKAFGRLREALGDGHKPFFLPFL